LHEFTYDQFVVQLRSALHYLYDPVHLRNSSLVDLLRLTDEFDRAAALQQILSEAIRSLKPAADEPPQSRAWRIYDTLTFLHIRQLERDAVALQLGISERQLRREQRVALEVLAQQLWPKIDHNPPNAPTRREMGTDQETVETNQALSDELIWLGKLAVEQRLPLGEALNTVQSLARSLAQQWQVPLEVAVQPDLAELPVTPLALRSVLLTVLSVAIPRAGRGPVLISALRRESELELTVTCNDHSTVYAPFSEKDSIGLQTARDLAAFYNARLSFSNQERAGFSATLALPVPEQIPVLVIDDNADWIELLQRVAAGSRYQVTGTSQPEQAPKLADKMQPAVIILDVMMHNVDGWQVLSELRHLPATAHIPIVVCTILPVEDLALSLGANAFLQKPVTQQQFLKTLNELIIEN
jgi:CheY-like chemotaxis protein